VTKSGQWNRKIEPWDHRVIEQFEICDLRFPIPDCQE
jgi:hypothetical protein